MEGANSEIFGERVFSQSVMEKMLPKPVFQNILAAIEGREKINPANADLIAIAMKEWALSHGATHYCHWFHPLSGASAEKHDSFIDWQGPDGVIERFGGKQLIQGEPDASSFPSGGLRCTYEARGYTGWDPSSPVFLWNAGDGLTLFVPSVFFSWTGDVLDCKIPLLRSDHAMNKAALRLLRVMGTKATQVYSTLGCEQEYFVIDRALFNLRPDLQLLGRTVYGAPSVKGQQLQDHYFGSVKDRILAYMQDFEDEALRLGIPVKTRHNEVAPAQHEVAPVFEKASIACDHNIMLMEVMRQVANRHDLACLLQEKPFAAINGSGKHHNWSLSTDTGINLLEPGESPESSLQFLTVLTAIVSGVHRHERLLRAVVASAGNDLRLGGHEAPPAIISVYLGSQLEAVLDALVEERETVKPKGACQHYDLGIPVIPRLTRDNTDRNRTSPFAFTGNKFEFRAPGSSAHCAEPTTVLNVVVAEALNHIMDEIEAGLSGEQNPTREQLVQATLPVLRKYVKASKAIRFFGDNYSDEWKEEAARRGLSNVKRAPEAYGALLLDSTKEAFKGILTESELRSRYEILQETYSHIVEIHALLMVELYDTQILPAALRYQKDLAKA
ncbi:MAG: glutamine synthetase III, partial [Chlamydiia bacterium]|nr:glutamine synthetase III [Chlamydiia bacterium]